MCLRMESNQWPSGFQPDALPLSYLSIYYIFIYIKKLVNNKLNIKKPNQIYIKCFQFNWVNWSNLYLGNVPLVAIATTQNINILKSKTKYGIY